MITFSEYLNNNFLIEAKELTRPLAYLYHAGYGFMLITSTLTVWSDYEIQVGRCEATGEHNEKSHLIKIMDVFCVEGSKQAELLKKCGYKEYKRYSNSDEGVLPSEKGPLQSLRNDLKMHKKDEFLNKDIIRWKANDEYAIGKYLYEFAKTHKKDFARKIIFKNG